MFGRRKVAAVVAEFLGTAVLTLLILSVQRSTIGVPFFVALGAGLAFIVMSFSVGAYSGGYFNPALTLAMWTARKVKTLPAVAYIAAQFLGAWAAYGVYKYFANTPMQNVGGHFTGRILVAEAIGTGIFAFAFAAVVYQRFVAATASVVAGLALTVGMIAASTAAIGVLNPAVALGIRSFVWGSYVLGPVLGAVIGVNLYGLLFAGPEALVGETSDSKVKKTPVVSKPVTAKRDVVAVKKPAAKKKPAARKRAAKK
jgi:aquaporin Z